MWIDAYPVFYWLTIVAASLLLLAASYKVSWPLRQDPRLPPHLQANISWKAVGIVGGAVVLLLAMSLLTGYLSNRQLRTQVVSLSSDIVAFAEERNRLMPVEGKPNWDEYTRTLGRLTDETLSLYTQRYALRVAKARREFARRGLTDDQLDKFYDRPKTPLAIRMVSERLEALARQL